MRKREREKERERCRIFLKGMTGALATFRYVAFNKRHENLINPL